MKKISLLMCLASCAIAQVRINCGGGQFVDALGNVWAADQFFSGGAPFAAAPGVPEPYGTVRYLATSFTYTIPTGVGSYDVNLYFQEEWVTAAGGRVFNVTINGQPFLTNFDMFAAGGSGLTKKTTTVQSTGSIQIVFTTVVRNAMVNAIEVLPKVITPPPPTTRNMRTETWTFQSPVPGGPPANNAFQVLFNPDPTTQVSVYLNGLRQSSLPASWDYNQVQPATTPPTYLLLNSLFNAIPALPPGATPPTPITFIVTIQYWTTEGPADEVLR